MKIKSIKQNALLNILYTITNMIFPLITYPYVSRVLSVVGMGKVSFFTSVTNYAVMIGSLGISTYGIRAVAKVRDDKNALSKVATELLVLSSITTSIVVLSLVLSVFFVDKFKSEQLLFIINLLVIVATPFGLNWLYSGLEQYSYITKRTIVFKTISVLLVFLLIKNSNDYAIYAALTAFSTVGAYVCNLFYARRFVHFSFKIKLEYRKHLKPMLLLFASTLAVSVYTNLDTIMLGFISGDKAVGLYSIASKIKWLLLSAVNAVSAVLLPRLSNYISNDETDKYNLTLKKSASFVFLITIPLAIYFMLEAFDCIMVLGGKDYAEAVPCMQVLMPILIISGFSNVIGNQILVPKGRDSEFMRAVIAGAIVDLFLNTILMPYFGATGGAIATLIAELIQMSIQLYYSKKEILININYRTLFNATLSGIIAGVAMVVVRSYINYNYLSDLLLTVIVYGIVYFLGLFFLKESYINQFMGIISKKLKK